MTSRFHIVKIDTGPQKRGRWTCHDREEPTAAATGVASPATATSVTMMTSSSLSQQPGDATATLLVTSTTVLTGGSGVVAAATPNTDDVGLSPLSESGEMSSPPSTLTTTSVTNTDDGTPTSAAMPALSMTPAARDSPLPTSKFVVTGVPGSALQQVARKVPAASGLTTAAAVSAGPIGGGVAAANIGASPSSAFVRVQPQQRSTPVASADQFAQQQPTAMTTFPTDVVHGENTAAAAVVAAAAAAQVVASHLAAAGVGNDIAAGSAALLGSILPPAAAATVAAAAAAADRQVVEPAASLDGTLAIDNKIEQAMDLVKTHLRYAVREEVEVLKQRIQELEKYVDNLEKENKLLREYAPAEILAQLRLTSMIQQQDAPPKSISVPQITVAGQSAQPAQIVQSAQPVQIVQSAQPAQTVQSATSSQSFDSSTVKSVISPDRAPSDTAGVQNGPASYAAAVRSDHSDGGAAAGANVVESSTAVTTVINPPLTHQQRRDNAPLIQKPPIVTQHHPPPSILHPSSS